MVARRSHGLVLVLVLILLAACGGSSTPAPSAAPTSGPGATPGSSAAASQVTGGGALGAAVKAGDDLCGLLGPGDFAAAGVAGAGKATENNQDPSNVYCVFAGASGATGGIEFDAFLAASSADSKASYDSVAAPMLDFAGEGKAAFPDADGAVVRNDIPGPYAGIAIWKGKLVFDIGIPSTATSKAQLIALAKLVLQRAAGLT